MIVSLNIKILIGVTIRRVQVPIPQITSKNISKVIQRFGRNKLTCCFLVKEMKIGAIFKDVLLYSHVQKHAEAPEIKVGLPESSTGHDQWRILKK